MRRIKTFRWSHNIIIAQGSGEETWGKETIGETRRRWEDNIKMDIQEEGGGCGDWMKLAQDRDR